MLSKMKMNQLIIVDDELVRPSTHTRTRHTSTQKKLSKMKNVHLKFTNEIAQHICDAFW